MTKELAKIIYFSGRETNKMMEFVYQKQDTISIAHVKIEYHQLNVIQPI